MQRNAMGRGSRRKPGKIWRDFLYYRRQKQCGSDSGLFKTESSDRKLHVSRWLFTTEHLHRRLLLVEPMGYVRLGIFLRSVSLSSEPLKVSIPAGNKESASHTADGK